MMRTISWRLALVGLAVGLTACTQGFRPLYGESAGGASAREALNNIEVSEIGDDRVGQQLRNGLIERLNPAGQPANPRYRLAVTTSDQLTDLLVQENTTVRRRNFTLRALYRLVDTTDGELIYQGTADRASSLNRLDSEYANVIALRDAQERAAAALADAISQRVGVVMATLGSPEGRRKAALRKAANPEASTAGDPVPVRNTAFPPQADPAPPLSPPPGSAGNMGTAATTAAESGRPGDFSSEDTGTAAQPRPSSADASRFPAPEAIDPADL